MKGCLVVLMVGWIGKVVGEGVRGREVGNVNELVRFGGLSAHPMIMNPVTRASMSFVRRFQQGTTDWHDLAVEIEATDDASRKARDDELVNVLQGARAASYDGGPLAKLESCPLLRDKCFIHGSMRECVEDELCGWCRSRKVCVDRFGVHTRKDSAGRPKRVCEEEVLVLRERRDKGSFLRYGEDGYLSESGDVGGCGLVVSYSRLLHYVVDGNNQMFYHFALEFLPAAFRQAGPALLDFRSHVVVGGPHSELGFVRDYLRLFTNSCLRSSLPQGVCFRKSSLDLTKLDLVGYRCTSTEELAVPSDCEFVEASGTLESEEEAIALGYRPGLLTILRHSEVLKQSYSMRHPLYSELEWSFYPKTWPPQGPTNVLHVAKYPTFDIDAVLSDPAAHSSQFIVGALQLEHVIPPSKSRHRPRIGLISRMNKRLLLNEVAVVAELRNRGMDVEVLRLEHMSLYEQIRAFRSIWALIGVHGSGLTNVKFMHPGTALIQILPYKVNGGTSFFQPVTVAAGVKYFEIMPTQRNQTVPHFHYMSSSHAGHEEQDLNKGHSGATQPAFFSFWINQDTIIDPVALADLTQKAIQ